MTDYFDYIDWPISAITAEIAMTQTRLNDLHAARRRYVRQQFREVGDDGRNVSEIARRAGISRQAVYDMTSDLEA